MILGIKRTKQEAIVHDEGYFFNATFDCNITQSMWIHVEYNDVDSDEEFHGWDWQLWENGNDERLLEAEGYYATPQEAIVGAVEAYKNSEYFQEQFHAPLIEPGKVP